MRRLSIEQIWKLSAPRIGVSGALSPNAYTDFKKLQLTHSTGYDVVGFSGSVCLVPGNWKYRGG